MQHMRRSVLKGLVGLPILAGLAEWFTSDHGHPGHTHEPEQTAEYKRRFEAVEVLRLVNTAERIHLEATGTYVPLLDLDALERVRAWLDATRREAIGSRRALFTRLDRSGRGEIVAGWTHHFELADDRKQYTIWLRDGTADGLRSFASDETGVIREGDLVAAGIDSGTWRSAADVLSGAPIGGRHAPVERSPV
jgi:hypothetical protein